jgi:DNA invertase Pin-like site-specific DNA recombinase
MSVKITPEHLSRAAVVYVRQSTMSQVMGNLESQRRQYDLAQAAEAAGFKSVTVIDDDLGRSGSGTTQRPGFERLVAMVCSGDVGAVYCIEASRLARNGRDWHHLIDLCALAGALVIDPDGAYDPRLVNDRLLLGLKGTMSEYELSLLRQRGIAARDSKAQRGEYRFMLPPGFCWNELGKIEIDPDEHVAGVVRLVFTKFRELGSARQVFLWLRAADIKMPVVLRNVQIYKLNWKAPAYHTVMQILHNPLYAGAYAFGRIAQKTRIVDGRARKVSGFKKPREEWNVLLRDNHPGYISWQEYEDNQRLLLENAQQRYWRPIRLSAREKRSSPPSNGSLKSHATKRLLPHADTSLWIPPSATSPANSRRAGMAHWSGLPSLKVGSRSCAPHRRKLPKSTAPCFCNLRRICSGFGMHRPRTHAPSSGWFTSWSERLFAISMRTPMRRFCSSTGPAAGTRRFVLLALRRADIRAIWHRLPWTHFANSLVIGLIESSPCRSIGCAARPATARPGRRFACGKCANA